MYILFIGTISVLMDKNVCFKKNMRFRHVVCMLSTNNHTMQCQGYQSGTKFQLFISVIGLALNDMMIGVIGWYNTRWVVDLLIDMGQSKSVIENCCTNLHSRSVLINQEIPDPKTHQNC